MPWGRSYIPSWEFSSRPNEPIIPTQPQQWLRLLLCAFQTQRHLVRSLFENFPEFPGGGPSLRSRRDRGHSHRVH
jgi:hypothetical protein